MKSHKLLIATKNKGKMGQISKALEGLELEFLVLQDVGLENIEIEENGQTLEENSRIKALEFAKLSGLWTLADDAGLEIDALGGEPGIHSRRWLEYDASDQEMIDYTLARMAGVPFEKRQVVFKSVITICSPTGECFSVEGRSEGIIAEKPSDQRIPGLPYSCLYYIPGFGKIFTALTPEEQESTSHRIKAVKKAKEIIQKKLLAT